MLIESTNEQNLSDGMNTTVLKEAMLAKGYSFATMEGLTLIAEGTIKNIINNKVRNTSAYNLNKICKVLDVPLEKVLGTEEAKKQIENKGIKDDDASIIALKEIYEKQQELINETNEKHINNIRTHYEQHHMDLKDNYERIIDMQNNTIVKMEKTHQAQIEKLEKQNKAKNIVIWILAGILFALFVGLIILELSHPDHGWLTFRSSIH